MAHGTQACAPMVSSLKVNQGKEHREEDFVAGASSKGVDEDVRVSHSSSAGLYEVVQMQYEGKSGLFGRRAAVASIACCLAALMLLVLPQSSARKGQTELLAAGAQHGVALVGKNSFLLNIPRGGGDLKMPTWEQLKDGDIDLGGSSAASSSSSSSRSTTTHTVTFSSSYPPEPSRDSSVGAGQDGGAEGKGQSYSAFLDALQPDGGGGQPSSPGGGDGGGAGQDGGDGGGAGQDGGDGGGAGQDGGKSVDSNADGGDVQDDGGDDDGSGSGGDNGQQATDEEDEEGARFSRETTPPEHRSATVVVHSLSREFDHRFREGKGAYDFCVRDKLTHEELAECIKHMLMKSSPGYKPAADQALLDKVSVLKLQIKEIETQSAREIRKVHSELEQTRAKLLTAVPYAEFKELRAAYERKLRMLQRLVVRFTRDMASEAQAARQNSYERTASEVARALRARISDSEGDERVKALWRMLGRRVRDAQQRAAEEEGRQVVVVRTVERHGGQERQGGEDADCCHKPKIKIPRLMPFEERRAYMERTRNREERERRARQERDVGVDRREEEEGGNSASARQNAIRRLSDSFDRRIEGGRRAGLEEGREGGGQGEGQQSARRMDPDAVRESATQHTNAALKTMQSGAVVQPLPNLPALPPLHLPASLGK